MRVAWLLLGVLLSSGSASSAEDRGRSPSLGEAAPVRPCSQAMELEAAKHALAEGDRRGAIRHLRRAQALLAACERNAVNPEPEWESTPPPRGFAKAPGAGPPTSRYGTSSHPGYSSGISRTIRLTSFGSTLSPASIRRITSSISRSCRLIS